MDELKHYIELMTGDWSYDGHGHTSSMSISCNRSRDELRDAYARGAKITGVDLTKEVACNFEDNGLPLKFVERLMAHGFVPAESVDGNEDEGYTLWTDSFPLVWLFIASVGDPDLRYEEVTDSRIRIGGYGLFR